MKGKHCKRFGRLTWKKKDEKARGRQRDRFAKTEKGTNP